MRVTNGGIRHEASTFTCRVPMSGELPNLQETLIYKYRLQVTRLGFATSPLMLVVVAILCIGCQTTTTSNPKPCTDPWYALVENKLRIADDAWDGIRFRSAEWLHAVDERLEMNTGDKSNPAVGSHSWCRAVDRKLFSSQEIEP